MKVTVAKKKTVCCSEEQSSCCAEAQTSCCNEERASCCGEEQTSSCCSSSSGDTDNSIETVSTHLTFNDILGAWKVRWGIGRMTYTVNPGLYAIGNPDEASPVLVSANYKLTFDDLRKELTGLDCWLLILDTKGVNVWCAAGKGTFGTAEIVSRIEKTGLYEIVTHRKLILPQLGAVGVSAHEVKKQSDFSVEYGPIRASDIKEYLASGHKATEEMRTVKFTTKDRLVLTPIEFVSAAKKSLLIFGVLFLLNLFVSRPFGLQDFIIYAGAVITGAVLTPILLPVIPSRAFAWKGWLLGLVWTVCMAQLFGWFSARAWMLAAGYLLALPSVAAYLAMNFTGSSTYTSFSGVTKEMKVAIPLIIISVAVGVVLLLVKSFIG